MTDRRREDDLDRLERGASSRSRSLFFGDDGVAAAPVADEAVPGAEPAEVVAAAAPDVPAAAVDTETVPTGKAKRRRRGDVPPPDALPEPAYGPVEALSAPVTAPVAPGAGDALEGAPGPQEPYVPVATGISGHADAALHTAAWTAGGGAEKSRLVREAVGELLAAFDAADAEGRVALLDEMRRGPREGGRVTRIYRLEPATRERLTAFARDERIPLAAVLRAAIERRYGSPAR